jgi:hypothetical protein
VLPTGTIGATMSERDLYLCSIDGAPAAVAVDLAWNQLFGGAAPQSGAGPTDLWRTDGTRDSLLRIRFQLRHPDEHGFVTAAERPALQAAMDTLEEGLAYATDAALVGWVTTAGFREAFFYVGRGSSDAEARRLLAATAWADATVMIEEDPTWSAYRTILYPDAHGLHFIRNWRTMDALRAAGDDLSGLRLVTHHVAFRTVDARDRFIAEVRRGGFRIDIQSDPRIVHLVHPCTIDAKTFFPVTDVLFAVAEGNGGRYDGWSADPLAEQGLVD